VARRPSVFVRPLSMDEGRKVQRITRTAKDPVRLRRAIVVMMSGQGQTVRDITSLLQVSEDYVRDVIHAFNERGFEALNPKWSGGRRKKIGEQLRSWICTIARTSPADWGITGFSTWSLTKLRDHLLARASSPNCPGRRCAGSCATAASRGRPPPPGRPPPTRTSSPRCAGSWTSTTTHPRTAGSSAWTSSGR
jgi:transposase